MIERVCSEVGTVALAEPRPTPARRLLIGWGVALGIVFGLNAWIGTRLPELLQDHDVRYGDELDRRAAAFPRPEAVRLLLIGNSHVQAGLRPPELTSALGLPPDGAFSFALPGSTVVEQAVLFERHRTRFPAAQLALVGVDEFLFTASFEVNVRYMTRHSVADRWRWARRFPEPDRRLALTAVRFFPLMDFKNPLADAWREAPRRFLRRMVGSVPAADGPAARMRGQAWPWGLPPVWDDMSPGELADLGATRRTSKAVNDRAERFLPATTQVDVANGLADLEALVAELSRAGLDVVLVGLPYEARMRSALRILGRGRERLYHRDLDAFLARTGRSLVQPDVALSATDFVDPDHLSREGARKVAGWLEAYLRGTQGATSFRR